MCVGLWCAEERRNRGFGLTGQREDGPGAVSDTRATGPEDVPAGSCGLEWWPCSLPSRTRKVGCKLKLTIQTSDVSQSSGHRNY
eukprot:g56116.t1